MVSVIVKRPVLPPSVVDGRSRNPLYYYYYYRCTFILYFCYRQPVCTQVDAALSGNKADNGPHTNRPKGKGEKELFHAKIKLLTVMTGNFSLFGKGEEVHIARPCIDLH